MTTPTDEEDTLDAAYDFVTTMMPRADDKFNIMWHGWALREAFIAGAEWQRKRAAGATP